MCKLNKEIICMFKACRREIGEKKEQPEKQIKQEKMGGKRTRAADLWFIGFVQ